MNEWSTLLDTCAKGNVDDRLSLIVFTFDNARIQLPSALQ
jgi:hypothetical protein